MRRKRSTARVGRHCVRSQMRSKRSMESRKTLCLSYIDHWPRASILCFVFRNLLSHIWSSSIGKAEASARQRRPQQGRITRCQDGVTIRAYQVLVCQFSSPYPERRLSTPALYRHGNKRTSRFRRSSTESYYQIEIKSISRPAFEK
jgi:hypothetical protein